MILSRLKIKSWVLNRESSTVSSVTKSLWFKLKNSQFEGRNPFQSLTSDSKRPVSLFSHFQESFFSQKQYQEFCLQKTKSNRDQSISEKKIDFIVNKHNSFWGGFLFFFEQYRQNTNISAMNCFKSLWSGIVIPKRLASRGTSTFN